MGKRKSRDAARKPAPATVPPLTTARKTDLATLQQLAAESGVPYTSVRKLVLEGHLPKVQLGDSKRTWVKRRDWERLIAASTETVTPEHAA